MTLEFRLLGPVDAIAESGPLDLGGPKQRALLALLLLRANEVLPRDRLVDELWGDVPPPTARDMVKVYVGRLRRVLEQNGSPEHLLTQGGGYLLQIEHEQLDLHRFQALVAQGSEALAGQDPRTAAATLRQALSLWRGPALLGLDGVAFAAGERARLEELRLAALEERIEADLALGHASAVVPELRQLTAEHPYRERLHQQLMRAMYGAGRQAEALAAYQDARAILDELGIEPSTGLRDLERAILTQDPALEPKRAEAEQTAVAVDAPADARRRRRPILVGVAVVVAAAAIGIVFLTRADGAIDVRPNSVAVIDPSSNKLVAAVPVGTAPAHVVAAAGRVWVANSRDGTVSEIDPDNRKEGVAIPLGAPPTALAAAPGSVWVVTGGQIGRSALQLVRIDPRFGAVSRRVALGTATQGMPREPLAFGMATVWAPGRAPGTLVRRDPVTLAPRGTIDLGTLGFALAASSDAMWGTTLDNRLLRIDPVTNEMIEDLGTGGRPLDIAVGGGAVWVASWSDDVVVRYDPGARSEISIPVGDGPAAVSVGFGSVWVACSGDGTIWRIDLATRKVVAHWELGASPEDVAAGAGAVWAAVYSELPP